MSRIVKILSVLNLGLISFLLVWCIGWLFVGAYYSFPNAEDLSLSYVSRESGVWYSIKSLLISYDGRYFTNFLHAINPLAFDWVAGYKLMPVIGILFFISSLWFFFFTIFKTPYKLNLLLFSILFSVVHFALAPSLPHDLYWMVSSFVYLYPWAFTFLWVGAYLRYIHCDVYLFKILWFLFTVIAMICCIGMNEMFLVTNVVLILSILYLSQKASRQKLIDTIPIVIIGVACIVFFITSPGISLRMASNIPDGGSLYNFKGIVQSIIDYKLTSINFFFNGIAFFSFLLVLIHTSGIQFRYNMPEVFWRTRYSISLLFFLLIIACLMTMAYYLPMQIDSGYPDRIFNSVVILQQLIFFVLTPVILFKLDIINKISSSISIRQTLTFFLLLLLMVLILKPGNNISEIYKEYCSGIFDKYNRNMNQRYSAIMEARGKDDCWRIAVLDSLEIPPRTIYYGPDIVTNRKVDYWNASYEVYFKIDEVRLQGDTVQKCCFKSI